FGKILINLQKTAPKFPEEFAIKKLPSVTINNLSELQKNLTSLQTALVTLMQNPQPIEIKNLPDLQLTLQQRFESLQQTLTDLEKALLKGMQSNKPVIPSAVQIKNPVEIVDFVDLLDGIEELKK